MEFTDDTVMPWGKHKGKKMKDVPAHYLDWLQGFIEDKKNRTFQDSMLLKYIQDNRNEIDLEMDR